MIKRKLLQERVQIREDKFRYINLGLFFLVAICNSVPLQAFTGVSFIISQIYKQSILVVNINWISYFVLYLIMILPANYIIDQKGLKFATSISEIFMIIGLSLRCLINVSFTYFLFGTLLCSLGFCLTISAANKLPSVWFPHRQIFWAKSLLILSLILSDGIGFLISTFFITKDSTKTDVLRFFLIQSGVIIIFQVLNMIYFRNKPQNPPSYFSQKTIKSFGENLKNLLPNTNYWFLFFSLTFVFINLSVFFVGIAQFEKSFDVSQGQLNIRMLISGISGIIGWYLNSRLFNNQYKWKSAMLLIMSFVFHCFLWLGFETKQQWLINLCMAGIGISVFPLIATIIDWASQVTFPVGEGTSGGSLFFGGFTFGSIATILFGIYIGHNFTIQRSRITIIMFLVFIVLSFLFVMLAEQNLKRKQYEESKIIEQKITLISIQTEGFDEPIV